jgi:hypothetical protein
MNIPQLDNVKKFILDHFEVEKLKLDLLNGRLIFDGKLKEDSNLGTLSESSDLSKINAYLRGDFYRYVMIRKYPLRENRLIVELYSLAATDMVFREVNEVEIPPW